MACAGPSELLGNPLHRATQAQYRIRITPGGMLEVHGQKEFIHGLYMLPNVSDPWHEVQQAGFNLIHTGTNASELAKANDHKLYAWASLGSIPARNNEEAKNRIRKIISSLKDQPALLFWETEDEPTFTWKKTEPRVSAEDIIETARFIRSIDSSHPLYLNHSPTNLISTLQRYNQGADIIATDIYPVIPHGIREMYALWPDGQQGDFSNTYISQVGKYVDKMRRVAGPDRAVFMVLQAFAWENLREKDRDPKFILYPTREQLRFMAWQSIVHGANGLLWWGLSFTPSESSLWSDLKSVAGEVRQLSRFLCAPSRSGKLNLVYKDLGHSIDQGIEYKTFTLGRETLVVAVNADRNPIQVTIGGMERFGHCERLFDSQPVQFGGRHLEDRFDPFDTHIYLLK